MTLLLALACAALAQNPYEAEAAWWAEVGEMVPGRPNATAAIDSWLSRYGGSASPRVDAAQTLRSALELGDFRDQVRAFDLSRAPWPDLATRRWRRQIAHLDRRLYRGPIDLDIDGAYAQLALSPIALAWQADADPAMRTGYGGAVHVGAAQEIFDLEGLVLLGTSIEAPYRASEPDPTVRGELSLAVGGDGLLLFAGGGLSNRLGLHQFGQIQLTNDGDGPWVLLAARLQAEESLGPVRSFGLRSTLQIGFKFGETPD